MGKNVDGPNVKSTDPRERIIEYSFWPIPTLDQSNVDRFVEWFDKIAVVKSTFL